MKTKHYLFSLAMTGFFALGCENQYDAIEDLNLEEVSMVDPDTPEDAQPYILKMYRIAVEVLTVGIAALIGGGGKQVVSVSGTGTWN